MLLAMVREIEEQTGARLYDAAESEGVDPGGAILAELTFVSPDRGAYVFGLEAVRIKVADLAGGCTLQGSVVDWTASGSHRCAGKDQTLRRLLDSRILMALQPCFICNAANLMPFSPRLCVHFWRILTSRRCVCDMTVTSAAPALQV